MMTARTACKWVFSGLFSVSMLAIPACQTSPKVQPEALTGQVEEAGPTPRYKMVRKAHPKGKQWSRWVRQPVDD